MKEMSGQKMPKHKTFKVSAFWDEEAKMWCSDSDIDGLHIETQSLEEFEEILYDVARELIIANHMSPHELKVTPMKDLLPAILWRPPSEDKIVHA